MLTCHRSAGSLYAGNPRDDITPFNSAFLVLLLSVKWFDIPSKVILSKG